MIQEKPLIKGKESSFDIIIDWYMCALLTLNTFLIAIAVIDFLSRMHTVEAFMLLMLTRTSTSRLTPARDQSANSQVWYAQHELAFLLVCNLGNEFVSSPIWRLGLIPDRLVQIHRLRWLNLCVCVCDALANCIVRNLSVCPLFFASPPFNCKSVNLTCF